MNCLCTVLLAALISPYFAHATLGESGADSVARDHHVLHAKSTQISTHKNYQVHMFTVHAVNIKEFVGSDGIVFAVSWRGLTNPDLATLFGRFYGEYKTAHDKIPKGRRFTRQPVLTDNLTVIHGGHFPHLRGQAFIKEKLPAGWSMDDLL